MDELKNLQINLKVDHDEYGRIDSVEAGFSCNINNCGHKVEMYSNGLDTIQTVVCPIHGKLASFPNFSAFREVAKLAANGLLEMNGEKPIADTAKFGLINPERDPNRTN